MLVSIDDRTQKNKKGRSQHTSVDLDSNSSPISLITKSKSSTIWIEKAVVDLNFDLFKT